MALEDLTGHTIAYVVGNPGAPTAGETTLSGRLTSAGASVTFEDDNTMGTNVTAANGYTAWIIAETSASGTVGSSLATSTLPGFQGKLFSWDAHNIAGAGETVLASQSQFDLIDDTHYIATNAGLSAGTITVYNTVANMQYTTTANLASGVDIIGNAVGDTTRFMLGAVETGATLLGGSPSTAPARRVLWALWPTNPNLNANGLALWDAGINWMLGFDVTAEPQDVTADPVDYARDMSAVSIAQGVLANPADYSRATDGVMINQGVLADPATYDRVMSFVVINGDTGTVERRLGSNGRLRRVIRRDLGR